MMEIMKIKIALLFLTIAIFATAQAEQLPKRTTKTDQTEKQRSLQCKVTPTDLLHFGQFIGFSISEISDLSKAKEFCELVPHRVHSRIAPKVFLPCSLRDGDVQSNILAPGELTNQNVDADEVKHYYFSTDQVKVSALHYAFSHVIKFDRGGSAFIVSSEGHVITNLHVYQNLISKYFDSPARPLHEVSLIYQGKSIPLAHSELVYQSDDPDVVIIKVPELANKPHLHLSEKGISQGNRVFAIGNPEELDFTALSVGEILPAPPYQHKSPADDIVSDTEVRSGNSGGPLLNAAGDLVGLVYHMSKADFTTSSRAVGGRVLANIFTNLHLK